MLLQLLPFCEFGVHVCNMGIPLLSSLFCQGSLVVCQITQFQSVLTLAVPEHGSVNVYDVRKQVNELHPPTHCPTNELMCCAHPHIVNERTNE